MGGAGVSLPVANHKYGSTSPRGRADGTGTFERAPVPNM